MKQANKQTKTNKQTQSNKHKQTDKQTQRNRHTQTDSLCAAAPGYLLFVKYVNNS